ncbi:MAG: hypothetical protein M2R45_03505 [Verrucomicrobia subdivision 3 bacterium]|nr:hypothetical protein [Limisphaerales bacterium]MCS1415901.1 hypothetical protein [Limisphaerales bacterium]
MKCLACDRELRSRSLEKVTVDVCESGCGGIWLDAFELARVDEQLPQGLKEVASDPMLVADKDRRHACPRCEGIKMQRHFFSNEHRVEVDSCPGCGGYWLDAGELTVIRQGVKKPKKKKGAVRGFIRSGRKEPGKKRAGAGLNRIARKQTSSGFSLLETT